MEEKLAMVQEKSSTPGAVDQMKTRELQAKTEQIRQLVGRFYCFFLDSLFFP